MGFVYPSASDHDDEDEDDETEENEDFSVPKHRKLNFIDIVGEKKMDSFFITMQDPGNLKAGEKVIFKGECGDKVTLIELVVDGFSIGTAKISNTAIPDSNNWSLEYNFKGAGNNRVLILYYKTDNTVSTRKQLITVEPKEATIKPDLKLVESKVRHTTQGAMELEGLVVHYTAGQQTTDPSGAIGMANDAQHAPYAYWVLASDGTIYKTHELNRWGYHCGTYHHRTHLGIEIMCPGKLVKVGNDFFPWYNLDRTGNPKGNPWPQDKIRYFAGNDLQTKGYYAKYTDEQEKSLIALVQYLKDHCAKFKIDNVVGHDEILPDYKDDPGGSLSMPMPVFREYLKKVIV